MRSADLEQFAEVMNGLALVKSGAKLSKEALRIWWNAFQDWSIDEFTAAAGHLLRTNKWMPDPSEFTKLRRAGEETSGEAWKVVLSGAELNPDSRAYRAAAHVGGQYYIRHCDTEKTLPHIERRFKDHYDQLADREPIREALPQIARSPARAALKGPAVLADCIPALIRKDDPALAAVAAPAPAPTTPATPRVHVADSVRIERLVRALPTATDEELARTARVDVAIVRQVRAGLESAA